MISLGCKVAMSDAYHISWTTVSTFFYLTFDFFIIQLLVG